MMLRLTMVIFALFFSLASFSGQDDAAALSAQDCDCDHLLCYTDGCFRGVASCLKNCCGCEGDGCPKCASCCLCSWVCDVALCAPRTVNKCVRGIAQRCCGCCLTDEQRAMQDVVNSIEHAQHPVVVPVQQRAMGGGHAVVTTTPAAPNGTWFVFNVDGVNYVREIAVYGKTPLARAWVYVEGQAFPDMKPETGIVTRLADVLGHATIELPIVDAVTGEAVIDDATHQHKKIQFPTSMENTTEIHYVARH